MFATSDVACLLPVMQAQHLAGIIIQDELETPSDVRVDVCCFNVVGHKSEELPTATMMVNGSNRTRSSVALQLTLVLLVLRGASGFVGSSCRHVARSNFASSPATTTTRLHLYDNDADNEEPVPRFVANDKKDEDDYLETVSRMFDMQVNGREARDLLPPLSRNLESGVECYFEVTDRQVQNLAQKTACHPMDAAWALEACKGDVTEAWLAITTARRLLLNEQQEEEEEEDFDAELFSMLSANKEAVPEEELLSEEDDEDFEERKQRLKKERRDAITKQAITDAFDELKGKADGDWLPTPKNKKPFEPPIDDEPWFTG